MNPSTSVSAFEEFVEERGASIPGLTVREGVMQMVAFYQTVLPAGCGTENGDMLLFQ
jgi:hypothetical protein